MYFATFEGSHAHKILFSSHADQRPSRRWRLRRRVHESVAAFRYDGGSGGSTTGSITCVALAGRQLRRTSRCGRSARTTGRSCVATIARCAGTTARSAQCARTTVCANARAECADRHADESEHTAANACIAECSREHSRTESDSTVGWWSHDGHGLDWIARGELADVHARSDDRHGCAEWPDWSIDERVRVSSWQRWWRRSRADSHARCRRAFAAAARRWWISADRWWRCRRRPTVVAREQARANRRRDQSATSVMFVMLWTVPSEARSGAVV